MAVLLAGLVALLSAGCSQQPTTVTEPSPTAAGVQPNTARPAQRPTIPARLPEPSTLPSFVDLELVGSGDATGSSQQPAYLMAELSGREISSVSLVGGSVLEDGRRRLFFHEPIDPDPTDDEWPGRWANGIHDLVQTWDFVGDYLWDG